MDSKELLPETPSPIPDRTPASMGSIACLFARDSGTQTDYFFSSFAASLEKEALLHNFVLQYVFTAYDISSPRILNIIAANQVDGIAVLGRCEKRLLRFLENHFHSVVYSGLHPIDGEYDQIICDGCEAGAAAVRHLIELGHTKIAYLGEIRKESRFQGYRRALKEAGIPYHQKYTAEFFLSTEGGYHGASRLLKDGCDATAFFCGDDNTAIGAMRAVQERGLRIPEDISVISIDDIDTAQHLTPMLTTIHIPVQEMGKTTAQVLIDRIQGQHTRPVKKLLPFYIAHRESCQAPPSAL